MALAQANTGAAIPAAIREIVADLQAAGFQARFPTFPIPPGVAAKLVGTVQTGTGGFIVLISAFRCPNDARDDVCSLTLYSIFNDVKKRVNPDFLARANSTTAFIKVAEGHRPDGTPTMVITSQVFCPALDYSKTLPRFLPVFGAEISKVLAIYNAPQSGA